MSGKTPTQSAALERQWTIIEIADGPSIHRRLGFLVEFFQHWTNAQRSGTDASTIATACTKDLAKLLWINAKFVLHPIALPRRLLRTRIVARSVKREHAKLTCIPIFDPSALVRPALVHDVETMASGTNVCATAAAHTTQTGTVEMRKRLGKVLA